MANRPEVAEGLRRIPDRVQVILDSVHERIEHFVESHTFADYVFLGQGPLFGIASEGQLKVKEMSCSYAQVFHTLEFRHGPKAIVGPETLLTFLLSETGYEEESKVLEEMKALGATTLVIANQADDADQAERRLPAGTPPGRSRVCPPGGLSGDLPTVGSLHRAQKGVRH